MRDECKCFGPNEFDAVITIDGLIKWIINDKFVFPSNKSKWKRSCNANGHLVVVLAAQEFYAAFDSECQAYNERNKNKTTGIRRIVFQYMSKISRMKLLWTGVAFEHLIVYVDVVLAIPNKDKKTFPFGLKCDSCILIAKADRHAYLDTPEFPQFLLRH